MSVVIAMLENETEGREDAVLKFIAYGLCLWSHGYFFARSRIG